ncbi:galactosylceramide sulfotransferase [Cyprinodon tularosa]|uniref:galactosylceramide sulfotransferase n=1 Tax=Cyprinodon tularosa TaxID=77115 RepID=UPI0018E27E82|nr:galactosylceramide sulfotransferase [Cyprinodon tularosa]XP_038145909.1 galactosylceramide sulfotransferase [Cyprinodon tularosa]XP_038145910.1 galactosylceramide sulfotransferase [Cyprinodon tularosa]XP_038145911.1 galactosylceramide sulfotransferase [Cyprinodon tularosa]
MTGKQGGQWRSMYKRLILGTLLTGCMILLYCFSIQQISFNPPEVPVPYSCAHSPSNLYPKPATKSQNNSSQQCSPKVDIMFMKTHKTASSTFLNILFRFGEKHRLQFAFPDSRNDFFYPSFFQRSQVKDYKPGMCFNIICNHMRFNAAEIEKLLPLDTTYITILRDPAELFESSFHYFGRLAPFTWKIPGDNKLKEFLLDPHSYFDLEGYNSFYLKNLLFFDFGQDNTLEPEDPRVEEGIRLISKRFHLVMLVEHFEESLILLKDALCWDMDDLLFFKLNARKGSTVSKLTPELRARALKWNAIDWKLYQHFNQTFWKRVDAYGRLRMAKDVAELRRRNKEMASICIEGGHAVDSSSIQETDMQPWQPIGEKSIMGYNLKKNVDKAHQKLCRKMLTPELQYLTELGVNLWITKLWGHVRDIINW